MVLHEVTTSGLRQYEKILVSDESEIENFIIKHPDVVEKDLIILGNQVQTNLNKRVDVMGLDKNGNVVIMEIKQKSTDRDVIAQILEYGVWAENLDSDTLKKIAEKHNTLEKYTELYKKLEEKEGGFPDLNESQRWYIIAEKIDTSTKNIAVYLQKKDIEINCMEFGIHMHNDTKMVHTDLIVGNSYDFTDMPKEEVDWEHYIKNKNWKKEDVSIIQEITKDFESFAKKNNWEPKIALNKSYIGLQENKRSRNLLSLKVKKGKIVFDIRVRDNIKEFEPLLNWEWYTPKKLWRVYLNQNEIPKIEILQKIFDRIREN